MHYDKLFQNISNRVQLSQDEQEIIRSVFHPRKFKKGQYLVSAGAVCHHQIYVTEGLVYAYFIDLGGHEHVIQLAQEDWWIGDLESYVTQKPGRLFVRALEDGATLEAHYEAIQKLYNEVPKFERFHRILTQNGYVAFQRRVLQNLSLNAEDRYMAFREKYPKLESRIPQKVVASYLGMSAEFLSRLKKRIAENERS